MADYYQHFSVMLENLNTNEEQWARAKLKRLQEAEDPESGGTLMDSDFVFEISENGRCWDVWFNDAGGQSNIEHVANFVQSFLKKFRPQDHWGMEWASTCSKPRLDAYGGGAVFVTAKKQTWLNTGSWLANKLAPRGRKPR